MKLNLFSKKNLLDEMQEQALLKLESRGFWLLWWGLLISMAVQQVLGVPARNLLGEAIPFTLICLYLAEECIRKGIWDRHIQANTGANIAGSLVAGAVVFVVQMMRRPYWPGALCVAIFAAVLCFVILQLSVSIYRKRRNRLDHTKEDEETA